MPRKKGGGKRNRPREEDGNSGGEETPPNGVGLARDSSLETVVEQMLEKRYSTREAALAAFNRGLSFRYSYDDVINQRTSIIEALKKSLKKGREAEQRLAAHSLCLVALTLGVECADLYNEFSPSLVALIKDQSTDAAPDLITALGTLCFVGCTDELATKDHVALLEGIFVEGPANSQPNALRTWALLLSTLSDAYVSSSAFPKNIKYVYALMSAAEVETRLAAGEVAAFLFDVLRKLADEREENFDIGQYNAFVNTDDLIDRLRELASSSARTAHHNKKDRMKQKLFKEYLKTVEHGDVPEQVLTISDEKIVFDNWTDLLRLNYFRNSLGVGLQTHFENNELMQEIFDFSVNADAPKESLSRLEKRMYMSPNSKSAKARTRTRRGDIDKKNASFDVYEEDI